MKNLEIASPATSTADRGKIVYVALVCLTFVGIVSSALLKVPYPLRNDQALFLIFGYNIDQGSILYSDIWDIKQPGIFLFYYISGRFFGFTDVGIHIFEMLWNLGFAALIIALSRPHFGSRLIASIAPFFIIIQYAYTSASEQTQVETLVAFPILASALLAIRAVDVGAGAGSTGSAALAFLAGMCGGIAAAFKIPFALIVTVLHGYVLLCASRSGMRLQHVTLRLALPWAAGAGLIWLAMLGYFASRGAAAAFLLTTFVYPFTGAMTLEPAPLLRLLIGAAQLAVTLAPWLCLAAGFLLPGRVAERVPLAPLLLIWIGVEVFDILVQRFSWWPYHWFLLLAPAFLLCMLGLDRIVAVPFVAADLARRHRSFMLFVLLAPFTVVLNQLGQNAFTVVEAGWPGAFDGRAFRSAVDRNYDAVMAAVSAFPGDCAHERIYVLGTPAIYRDLGCSFDYRYSGQNLPYITAAQRADLVQQLRANPPEWIFIAPPMAKRMEQLAVREPDLTTLIDTEYRLAAYGDWGTWHRRIVKP